MYDSLLYLPDENAYREHYHQEYCERSIYCHDGFIVLFERTQFDHAFFKSANRRKGDKSIFAVERAERMMWMRKVLADTGVEMHVGWDTKRKRYDPSFRVCLVTSDDYMVIVRFTGANKATFVTAYLIDRPEVSRKVRSSPLWIPQSI